ncbi:MAG: peptidoglycan-binding protein [Muribaculaceae bacterium]|nr:peptidoglycan-binding protein [Muribaculaceae bacterium]
MYLAPDQNNKPDSTVREVQLMLNAIRSNYHHSWDYLTVDGIYGKDTANVVRDFQVYRGISSQMTSSGPVLGDTTISYIRANYNTVPQLKAVTGNLQSYKEPFWNTVNVGEVFRDFLTTFDGFLNAQLQYIKSLRFDNPQGLKAKYFSITTQFDPQLKNLKSKLQLALDSRGRKRVKYNSSASSSRQHLVRDLKKFNIVEKIEKQLEAKGISGKIELKALKGKPAIQIKGSGILQILVYKDVICDLCRITEYGSEEWKEDIRRDLSKLIDSLIVGVVSTFIAELIVALGAAAVAATGVTVSAGIIVIIVAIVATIIGLIISYFMYDNDFSFGELAMEGYSQIIAPIKV